MVDINGLPKAEVLCALYSYANPRGLGWLQAVPQSASMDVSEAEELLKRSTYFDYVNGRAMKVDLSSDEQFDEWLYDRDNGDGAAAMAVAKVREKRKNEI